MKSFGSFAFLSSDKLRLVRNYVCVVNYCVTILFCNDNVHGENILAFEATLEGTLTMKP